VDCERRGAVTERPTVSRRNLSFGPRCPYEALITLLLAGAAGCSSSPTEPTYLSRDKLLDPMTCNQCHPKQYQEWAGSMHAYASDDPLFVAMNERGQREANVGDFCVQCHAPQAVHEGATTDGLNMASVPQSLHGVTCFFCHAVDQVQDTHNNPLHLASDNTMRGEYSDPVANTAHPSMYSVLHDRDRLESAQMCGSCHDIVNGHGAHIERTLEEWESSVFVQPNGGLSCGQCHMDQSNDMEPIANAPNVFSRRLHSHLFPGVDVALSPFPDAQSQKTQHDAVQAFLNTTLQSALCVRGIGAGSTTVQVILDNVASGHAWPSGAAQDRRAWVELTAYSGDTPIYQSGVVPMGSHVNDLQDPDIWIMRDCMVGSGDTEVHTFWDAVSNESSQLPAQITFDRTDPNFYKSHIVQTYPRATTALSAYPDRVTMSLHIESFGKDAFDDLMNSSDSARQTLAPYADTLPSFTIGTEVDWTPDTATSNFIDKGLPVSCISTGIDGAADKVPVIPRTKCKP
jgi:hypothetical protein